MYAGESMVRHVLGGEKLGCDTFDKYCQDQGIRHQKSPPKTLCHTPKFSLQIHGNLGIYGHLGKHDK